MTSPTFHFVRVIVPGDRSELYQVRLDSMSEPLIGSVQAEDGGWRASVLKADKLHIQWFATREAGADWLLGKAALPRKR